MDKLSKQDYIICEEAEMLLQATKLDTLHYPQSIAAAPVC